MAGKDTPNPGSGVADEVKAAHEARTTLPDTTGLAKGDVVDARLDNRAGDARPKRGEFPAAPQQVDGPDLAHQAEFTKRYLDNLTKAKDSQDLLGMHSAGPHGLSDPKEAQGKDRADESGGKSSGDGESGSPDVGKALPAQPR